MKILATTRPATATRPPARRLLEPVRVRTEQPTLPWDTPAVVAEPETLPPRLRRLATTVVAAMVEALAGSRPPSQLEGWVESGPLALLEHLRGSGVAVGARLRSLRIQQPSPDAVEVAAHLRIAGDSRAAAFRFSLVEDRWLVTRVELALRPDVVNRSGWP